MHSAVTAVHKAARALLAGDAALTALLGGPKVFDDTPRGTPPPYVTFGDAQARDWSTVSDRGTEQFVVLQAWSIDGGPRQALDIADRVIMLLDDAPLVLEGHRLVDCHFLSLELKREVAGRFARAAARFRVTTELI
jgi:hypothetical protein